MREIKNGDMYLKDNNQVIIIHGYRPAVDAGADKYITAVFGETYSGNFGIGGNDDTLSNIAGGDSRYTYIGNLSEMFRKVLDV